MALVTPKIFQIVGYQNSGKTTFMTKVLKRLKAEGLIVATIKHHGHGGKPDVFEQKDSVRHIENGAIASIVEGNGRLLLQAEKTSWTLQEKLQIMEFSHPDIILIEGYKQERYPKLLLVKEEEDLERLLKLDNIQFIIVWNGQLLEKLASNNNIPCFHINDLLGFEKIVSFIKHQLN
ncbi:molybdopterin-guanine dinucleotide biosynthesis protein B [Neobacillus sp. PS3-40]|uniref:molybdopterin-guanine dinucleotide biosynthesis protein B n=1 Tax=Neobacillus sp. PS3-40 TaxID=3070679 RepID=UPI0035A8A1CD